MQGGILCPAITVLAPMHAIDQHKDPNTPRSIKSTALYKRLKTRFLFQLPCCRCKQRTASRRRARYGIWILHRLDHFCNGMALSSRRETTTYRTNVRKPNGKRIQFAVSPCCTPKQLDCCSGVPLIQNHLFREGLLETSLAFLGWTVAATMMQIRR